MNLNAFLDLVRNNPEVSLTALGATFAVILGNDIWVTLRHRQRTLLGRVLGYAPKGVVSSEGTEACKDIILSEELDQGSETRVRTEIALLLHRVDQLEAQSKQHMGTDGLTALRKENAEMRQEIEQLKINYIAAEARRLARQGMTASDISATFGLSLDEAKAVCSTAH